MPDSRISDGKNKYSTMFHNMYGVVEHQNNISVVKLLVEQIDDYDGSNQIRRAYKLVNIIETPLGATGLHVSSMLTPVHSKGVSITTVADLFYSALSSRKNQMKKITGVKSAEADRIRRAEQLYRKALEQAAASNTPVAEDVRYALDDADEPPWRTGNPAQKR